MDSLSNQEFSLFKDRFAMSPGFYPYNSYTDHYGIHYFHNRTGQRCDEFFKETSKDNFLFAGCSYTYGLGLPHEFSWAYMVNNNLKGKKFHNLSFPGIGFRIIINDIYTYIRLFGKPKAIFTMFPGLSRDYGIYFNIDQNYNSYYNVELRTRITFDPNQPLKFYYNKEKKEKELKYLEFEKIHYDFYHALSQLEDYLESLEIPFLWTTWSNNLKETLSGEKIFKNYFELGSLEEYAENNIYPPLELGENRKYWLKAADKPHPHPGIMEQQFYSSQFLNKFDGI
jgi:hypothetical protein